MKYLTEEKLNQVIDYAKKRKEEILNTESQYETNGNVYYLDAEIGNDLNDGKSPETAWRSMQRVNSANLKFGDTILFKRGQSFRGILQVPCSGLTFSAYGEGAKPELLGAISASDKELWLPTKWKNVWMYKNRISYVRDIGGIIFNDGECWGIKVYINCKTNERVDMYRSGGNRNLPHGYLDIWNGRSMVHRECTLWHGPEDLKSDLEFYHDWYSERVYLYCPDGNPAEAFNRIEMLNRFWVIRVGNKSDLTFDNLSIKYAGVEGIGGGGNTKNLTIRNCEIAWTGGSCMAVEAHKNKEPNIGYGDDPTRLGNSVGLFGCCDGFKLENCYLRQAYDTGVTVQYGYRTKQKGDEIMNRVYWRDNVFDACNYAMELWLDRPEETNGFRCEYRDIELSGNICLNNGYGWGMQRPDISDVPFYGGGTTCYTPDFFNYTVHDNIFLNCNNGVVTSNALGKQGIIYSNNKIYTDSKIGGIGADFKFGGRPFMRVEATDENLEKLVETGCWEPNNEFAKLGKQEKDSAPYIVKI